MDIIAEMSTPSWFRNTEESKDSIHNRLSNLEQTVERHLSNIRKNQSMIEQTLKELQSNQSSRKTRVVSKSQLLEQTFRESNNSIIRVVIDMARKRNPSIIPWFHQQLNRYLQLPYIPSFKTQLTSLKHLEHQGYKDDSSDDESF